MPEISVIPNQIAKIIIAEPKSGWKKTSKNGTRPYKPDIKICLILAISTCRREKYLAKTKIKIIFINSDGWKVKPLKLSHLLAPLKLLPKKRVMKRKQENKRKRKTSI